MTARLDPDATRAHWDDLAATYDDAKAKNSAYYDLLKAVVDAAVPADRRTRVLEIGCGTGQILASLQPGAGLGVDISAEMIDRARAQYADRPELTFAVGDAAEVVEPGAYAAVVSADVLEHVPDWAAVVDAAVDACAPNGVVVLTTPSPGWALPLWILEKTKLKMPEGPHEFVSIRKIAARLRERGCTVDDVRTHGMIPARLAGLGPALSRAAARAPIAKWCGVIQTVIAHR